MSKTQIRRDLEVVSCGVKHVATLVETLPKPSFFGVITTVVETSRESLEDRRAITLVQGATMETKGTQVTIPDGIMKSGTNYYFLVAAFSVEGHDSGRPFAYSAYEATARMFTGVMTP